MENYDIVGIGNALVDIQVQVDDTFIEELGLTKGGMTLNSHEDQEKVLQKLSALPKKVVSGGSAANTIHGLGTLGANAYYVGKVSNDDYGNLYHQDMEVCGVGFGLPQVEDFRTGTSVILITPDAQRTMVTHLGASTLLDTPNINMEAIKNSKYLYVEGYLFTQEPTRSAAIEAAHYAKEQGIPIAFTLSDAFVVNTFYEPIKDFVETYADILFCNEVEALAFSKTQDSQEAFIMMSDLANNIFLTRAENGAWAAHKRFGKIEQAQVKSFNVNAIDTTGAGDLFAAGAIHGLLHNKNIEESAILGSYYAAQVVSSLGARLPSNVHTQAEKVFSLYSNE